MTKTMTKTKKMTKKEMIERINTFEDVAFKALNVIIEQYGNDSAEAKEANARWNTAFIISQMLNGDDSFVENTMNYMNFVINTE